MELWAWLLHWRVTIATCAVQMTALALVSAGYLMMAGLYAVLGAIVQLALVPGSRPRRMRS